MTLPGHENDGENIRDVIFSETTVNIDEFIPRLALEERLLGVGDDEVI